MAETDPEQKAGSFPWRRHLGKEATTGKKIGELKTNSSAAQLAFHAGNRLVAVADADGIQLWDIATAKQVAMRKMPPEVPGKQRSCVSCVAFAPDGRHLATGHPDGMIFIWNIDLPVAKPAQLAPKELDSLWTDLVATDASLAWRAVWRLADAPDEAALLVLGDKVKRFAAAPRETTAPLALADLESDNFAKRDASNKRLHDLGVLAEPALRERLKANPPLELRRRLELLLDAITETPPPLTREIVCGTCARWPCWPEASIQMRRSPNPRGLPGAEAPTSCRSVRLRLKPLWDPEQIRSRGHSFGLGCLQPRPKG